jgi:exopolysaccharide biosynthesis polyprenyl glycosylphosphotransferase
MPKIVDLVILFLINLILFNFPWHISIIISIFFFLGLFAFRTYDLEIMKSLNDSIIRVFLGLIVGSIFLLILYPLFLENFINRRTFIYNILISIIIFPIMHKVYYKLFEKYEKPKRYLVIGRKEEIGDILEEIQEKSLNKVIFVDYLNPSPVVLEKYVEEGLETKNKYDAILVADPSLKKKVEDKIEEYERKGIRVEYLPNLAEKYLKRIPLKVIEKFEEYYKISFRNVSESPAKRLLDIFGSIVGLIVFSPFMLIAAVAILIEDGRPVVFKQLRVGKDNSEFMLIKFRSMRKENKNEARFVDDEKHRILKIGKFIRPTRIDESLQFVNVLKGDMSIVGPRPEQIPFVRMFEQEIPYYSQRHRLKPGLTGWAQIMYKYSSSIEETKKKLSYDLYYIKNRNIFMDLMIILQTFEAVVWKRGAK